MSPRDGGGGLVNGRRPAHVECPARYSPRGVVRQAFHHISQHGNPIMTKNLFVVALLSAATACAFAQAPAATASTTKAVPAAESTPAKTHTAAHSKKHTKKHHKAAKAAPAAAK